MIKVWTDAAEAGLLERIEAAIADTAKELHAYIKAHADPSVSKGRARCAFQSPSVRLQPATRPGEGNSVPRVSSHSLRIWNVHSARPHFDWPDP